MRELEFAKKMAVRAGDFLRRRMGGRRRIRFKGRSASNLVTDMDHASEEMIVRALLREFPDHAIVAEERGASRARSPFRWFIDPVDGTTNYAHGLPIWSVSIGFEAYGRVQAGAVYAPCFGDLFWGGRGLGAWRNRERVRVGGARKLSHALLATGFPYEKKLRGRNLDYFSAFLPRARALRRPGAASLDLVWTACGALDGYWEFILGAWDMAAGLVILEEAGGRATRFDGSPVGAAAGDLVAANPAIHRQMLAVLRRVGLY
jgi:myo-inositol-1(or 4)-monophosphatase